MNDLANRANNGDQEALLRLWQGVSRLAYMVALRYQNVAAANGAVDADDLKQCAFLGFMEALHSFDPARGNFPNHVCMHVMNACRKALGLTGRERREHYQTVSMDEPLPGADDLTLADTIRDESAGLPFDQMELRADIEKALNRLPDELQNIIRLHDLQGLTMEQTAAANDCTAIAARNRRREGFRRMRKDKALQTYRPPIRLTYKGVRAFRSDWTSVVEAEVIRRLDGIDFPRE